MTPRDLSPARIGILAAAGGHLAIGAVLMGRMSLWGDEAFTAESVRQSTADLLSMLTRIDVNMSAYYLLLKGWTAVFGFSEVALRLPSLLMTTAVVLVGARLVDRWFGQMSGLVASIALAFSPIFLWIGMTVRPFAMLVLVTTVGLGLFVKALGSDRPGPWLLLAALDVLALYTSLLAALVIMAQVVHLLLFDRRFSRAQLLAAAVLVVGAMPTLAYLAPADTLNWLATPTLSSIIEVGYVAMGRWSGVLLAGLAVAGLALRPLPIGPPLSRHPHGRLLIPALVVVPLLVMVVLLPKQSLFTPPYLATVWAPVALLAGAVVVRLSRPWARTTAALLAVVLMLGVAFIVVPLPGLTRQDWRAATERLDALVAPGDAVVFPNTFYRVVGEYYGRRGQFADVAAPALPAEPWFSEPPDTYDRLKRTAALRSAAAVRDGLVGRDRVWLVGPDDEWMQYFTDQLTTSGWDVAREQEFPGVLLRYLVREAHPTG